MEWPVLVSLPTCKFPSLALSRNCNGKSNVLVALAPLEVAPRAFQGTPLAPELVRYAAWGSMGTSS